MFVVVLLITLFMHDGSVRTAAVPTHSMEECGDMAKFMLENPQVKAADDASLQCIKVTKDSHA